MDKVRKKRYLWSNESELKLLNIWPEHVYELRKTKRNWHVYKQMTRQLNAAGVDVSPIETKTKVGNMTKKYRAVQRAVEISGEDPTDWPLYDKVSKLLRPFKFNDDSVPKESGDDAPITSVFGTNLVLPPSPSSSSISACSRIGKLSSSSPKPQTSSISMASSSNTAKPTVSFTSWGSEKRKATASHDKQTIAGNIEEDSLAIKSEDENEYDALEKQLKSNQDEGKDPNCSNNDIRTDESHAYIKPIQQDEYLTFGKLVTEKLQNLRTPRLRSIAQHRISNIFFELETSNENEWTQ